jgi:hypothetical protein
VAAAPVLGTVSRAAVPVPGNPFAVAATADGRWSFVTLNSAVEVLSNRSPAPAADRQAGVPGTPQGEQLTHDGSYLLVADGSGAVVIDVARAEDGAAGAVAGTLSSPAGRGAVEVAALAGRPALLGLIPAGAFPREMTVVPHTDTLLVTDYLSEQVQAVNLATAPLSRVVEYFQVGHSPAFVSHIAGQHAQALGFDLTRAGREKIISPDKRAPVPVGEGREYQPVPVRIGPDQEHRAADAVERHQVALGAKVVHMQPAVIAPGVAVECFLRFIARLYDAVRMNDVLSGRQQQFDDIGRVVDNIDVNPQDPVFIGKRAGKQVVPATGECRAPLQLQLRTPPRFARGNLEPEIPLPDTY